MLFGYVLPEGYTTASHTGPFTLLSTNYETLLDGSPGIKTMFTQTSAGVQTLTINLSFGAHFQSELLGSPGIMPHPYPYLLVGVVNIGSRMSDFYGANQVTPSVAFTLSGKWAGGGVKTAQAVINKSGYSNAWALVRKDEQVGGGATTTVSVAMTADFTVTGTGSFGLGEIVIVPCDLLPLTDITVQSAGGGIENRTSGNVGWPVIRRTFRLTNGVLAPRTRADAYGPVPDTLNQSRPLDQMFARAAGTGSCVIAPFWRQRGTVGPDLSILASSAMMARLKDPLPAIAGTASQNLFKSPVAFEELL